MDQGTVNLGIDLGTTKCSATIAVGSGEGAIYKLLPIAQSREATSNRRLAEERPLLPSVLYVNHNGQTIVGEAAVDQSFNEPQRAISSVKLWLGRDVRLTVAENRVFTPSEVASEFLKAIVKTVRGKGYQIRRCVITVPASFDLRQKADMLEAGRKAGLSVSPTTLLEEPTAAFLSIYAKNPNQLRTLLQGRSAITAMVVDMGGGTLDVSVILLEDENGILQPTVLATSERSDGAGDHFDEEIAKFLMRRFLLGRDDLDLNSLAESQRVSLVGALLKTARELKHSLSKLNDDQLSAETVRRDVLVPLPSGGNVTIPVSMSSADLATALRCFCAPESSVSIQAQLQRVLDSDLLQSRVHGNPVPDIVLLAGQMTQLWLVREAIEQALPNVPIEKIPGPPEHAISLGAAVQASNRIITQNDLTSDILLRTERGYYTLASRGDTLPIALTHVPNALVVPQHGSLGLALELWEGSEERYDELKLIHQGWVRFPYVLNEGESIGLEWAMTRDYKLTLTPVHRQRRLDQIKVTLGELTMNAGAKP